MFYNYVPLWGARKKNNFFDSIELLHYGKAGMEKKDESVGEASQVLFQRLFLAIEELFWRVEVF